MIFPPDVPDPPLNVTATTQDDNRVHIHWEQPQNDGGTPIFNYVVELRATFSGKLQL